jgi:hypothetical protein
MARLMILPSRMRAMVPFVEDLADTVGLLDGQSRHRRHVARSEHWIAPIDGKKLGLTRVLGLGRFGADRLVGPVADGRPSAQ